MPLLLVYLRAALAPAYIDPGTGSLIVQAIIAALVAAPLFFRAQISRAVRAIRGSGDDRERGGETADATRR